MYLTIADIESAIHTSSSISDDAVQVRCKVTALAGYHRVYLHITTDTVTVSGLAAKDGASPVDIARVLVAPDLIDAVRRLFGLGGKS